MKAIILVCSVVIVFTRCNNKPESPDATKTQKDSSTVSKPDTIGGQTPEVQDGTRLDSISIPPNIHHLGIEILMPVMKDDKWLQRHLMTFKEMTVQDFYKQTKDDTTGVQDSIEYGEYMGIQPDLVYETDSVVSIIMQHYWGRPYSPSAFEFRGFNYDNRVKKEILVGDYFRLDTPVDSALLAKALSVAFKCEEDLCKILVSIPDFPFGFDAENVYFCFERYHLIHWGIFSIKKSYLHKYIRSSFQ